MEWPNGSDTWRGWATTQIIRLWRRVTRLEQKIIESDDIDLEPSGGDGFWGWADSATSSSWKFVATVTLLLIIALLWIILTAAGVNLPFTSANTLFVATYLSPLRPIYPDHVQKPDQCQHRKDEDDRPGNGR